MMPANGDEDLALFLKLFSGLRPEDQRFLHRLMLELSRRDWTGDRTTAGEQILDVTRRIAPGRVGWIRHQLGL